MKNGTYEKINTHEQNLNKYGYRKIQSKDATLPDKYFRPSLNLSVQLNQNKSHKTHKWLPDKYFRPTFDM